VNAVRRRAAFGQNFLRRPATARLIVGHTAIGPCDRVYDLGAGTGILTHELARTGARVIAVERDPNLARKLRQRFGVRVTVVESDLNDVAFAAPCKVVANIPFNRTASLLKRILFETPAPDEALLLLQREAAQKYAGEDRLSAVSLMAMPWFDCAIVHSFERHDFFPEPGVDTVLLRIVRRSPALLDVPEQSRWRGFVWHALQRSRPDARGAFRTVLSGMQWRLLCRDLRIPRDVLLRELSEGQWLGIYRFVRRCVPRDKQKWLLASP
jgi:23S rRNA (adenine-N6)-dimethyltransferase